MHQRKVLIVDDEKAVRQAVTLAFERENMKVKTAASGREALEILNLERFDLVILDVMMEDMDGFYVVDIMRKQQILTPVLFLSGKQEEASKILAITLGGDDYLTKPFSLAMLTAKSNALLRRSNEYTKDNIKDLKCGQLRFSLKRYQLYKGNMLISMTAKETALIKFLMENQNQVFTKEQIYQKVWHEDIVDDNTIMVYIKRLRDKIEEDSKKPKYLKTVWGLGYILTDSE